MSDIVTLMSLTDIHIPMRAVAVTPQVWVGRMAHAEEPGRNLAMARFIQDDRSHRALVGSAEEAVALLVMLGATPEHAENQVRTALLPIP